MIASNNDRVQCPYDVGDVLITSSATQPSTRWPGTIWQQIKDVFPLAAGDKHPVGEVGGAEKVALQAENNGPHTHLYSGYLYDGEGKNGYIASTGGAGVEWKYNGWNTGADGEGKPHENMPPYQVFYFWQRTA